MTGTPVELIPTLGNSREQLNQIRRFTDRRATAPDVYVVDVIWVGTLAPGLLDLSGYADEEVRSHLPQLLANDTVAGHLVALPFYTNVGMLYYRTDLLAKYGYRHAPGTWTELETMAKRIQAGERGAGNRGFWGFVWQGAAYEGLTCNALEWQASFGGGQIIEPDGVITIRNARAAQAFAQAARWIGTISPPSVLGYTESDSLAVFRAGNAAFLRHWSGGLQDTWNRDPRLRGNVAGSLLPAGPKGRAQTMGGFHLAVSRYSANPKVSVQLVRYLTSSQVQLRRARSAGYLPTIPRLYQETTLWQGLPSIAALREAGVQTWVTRPSTIAGTRYAAVSKAYYSAVHEILSHAAAAPQALAKLEEELAGITGLPTRRQEAEAP